MAVGIGAMLHRRSPSKASHDYGKQKLQSHCKPSRNLVRQQPPYLTFPLSFQVQFEHHQGHELVTHGVYSLMRHPSYVGWFWWSIGTQVVLANPVCFVIYSIASWKFFHDRIFMEEITLLNFFGEEYYKYQQRVPTGLPFIRGFKVEL